LDEVNRKQREYRHARAEHHRSESKEITPEQSAKNWLKHLDRHGQGPTPEESAKAWLNHLEREASADRSPSTRAPVDERGRARGSEGAQPDNPSPDRDHDLGL
jgi:hypothetical protein